MHPQEKQIASRVKLKIGENIISQLSILLKLAMSFLCGKQVGF